MFDAESIGHSPSSLVLSKRCLMRRLRAASCRRILAFTRKPPCAVLMRFRPFHQTCNNTGSLRVFSIFSCIPPCGLCCFKDEARLARRSKTNSVSLLRTRAMRIPACRRPREHRHSTRDLSDFQRHVHANALTWLAFHRTETVSHSWRTLLESKCLDAVEVNAKPGNYA